MFSAIVNKTLPPVNYITQLLALCIKIFCFVACLFFFNIILRLILRTCDDQKALDNKNKKIIKDREATAKKPQGEAKEVKGVEARVEAIKAARKRMAMLKM